MRNTAIRSIAAALACAYLSTAHALARGLSVKTIDLSLTPALQTYANDKVGKHINRYDDLVQSAQLHLKVEHRGGGLHDQQHHGLEAHIAEVTALCTDKQVIRVRYSSENMYATLDKLSDRLGRKLRKYKERKKPRGVVSGRVQAPAEDEDEDEDEQLQDDLELQLSAAAPAEPGTVPLSSTPWEVVKKKSFPMPAITVDEAVLCLEYIDHDFYVFRNAETDAINVVYKRNGGGVGLIEPEA